MTKRKNSTTAKIREHLTKYPDALAQAVAIKFKTSVQNVYTIKYEMKKEATKKPTEKKKLKLVQKRQAEMLPLIKEATPTSVLETLKKRGVNYGTFVGQSRITQALKRVIYAHAQEQHKHFTDDQIEALDMICNKIGRIVNGNPNYADSWVDIAGYAKLVSDRLETGLIT